MLTILIAIQKHVNKKRLVGNYVPRLLQATRYPLLVLNRKRPLRLHRLKSLCPSVSVCGHSPSSCRRAVVVQLSCLFVVLRAFVTSCFGSSSWFDRPTLSCPYGPKSRSSLPRPTRAIARPKLRARMARARRRRRNPPPPTRRPAPPRSPRNPRR